MPFAQTAITDGFGNALVDGFGNMLVLGISPTPPSPSGFTFAPSNGEFVLSAYERIQVRGPSIAQEHMIVARREVNFMFAEWSSRGVNLWEVLRTQTALTQGTATYTIPSKTIMVLDASIVINLGTIAEDRRYIVPISRSRYLALPNQLIQGPPLVYWFDRTISPTITFWPVPDGGGPYTFDWMGYTQIQDANLAGGETPDTPARWYDAIVSGLAHRLARIYRPDLEARRLRDAEKAWTYAATQDTENVVMQLSAIGYKVGDKFLQ